MREGALNIPVSVHSLFDDARAVIAFIGTLYALYFYHAKIGFKLTASYVVSGDKYSDTQISKLIVSNKKDKPVVIWSIHLVLDNDIKIDLYRPQEPVVLKAKESVAITIDKYAYLTVGSDRIQPNFLSQQIDFYINTGNNLVKCQHEEIRDSFLLDMTQATINRPTFDGHIYNDSVLYILIYILDGKKHTAFIDVNGFIGNEWGRVPNNFGDHVITPELIQSMLTDYGYDEFFSNYVCFQRTGADFDFSFKKKCNDKN